MVGRSTTSVVLEYSGVDSSVTACGLVAVGGRAHVRPAHRVRLHDALRLAGGAGGMR